MIFHKPEKEEMVRNYSTQSMSSLAFSEEPYRFPPVGVVLWYEE